MLMAFNDKSLISKAFSFKLVYSLWMFNACCISLLHICHFQFCWLAYLIFYNWLPLNSTFSFLNVLKVFSITGFVECFESFFSNWLSLSCFCPSVISYLFDFFIFECFESFMVYTNLFNSFYLNLQISSMAASSTNNLTKVFWLAII